MSKQTPPKPAKLPRRTSREVSEEKERHRRVMERLLGHREEKEQGRRRAADQERDQ